MKFKIIKDGNLYYPLVGRWFFGWHWDYLYPWGWASGQMLFFGTEEEAEKHIQYNESIGNHIERCYELQGKGKKTGKDKSL